MSPRAIEVGFPIAEINRLAVPERNSFKPIYQMHKRFARRASCVFRAILLGALKPASRPDGKPTDIMEEFYKDHSKDPDTRGALVVDPFMGGGTTVVEALRLGCRVIGNDLNPVAWFIVKTEVEPVDLEELKKAYERLAQRPVDWNNGRPLAESLKSLYKTELAPGFEADVIYTFWVKHAICTAGNCHRETPLFKDYLIAQKTMSVRYHKDIPCPRCHEKFDWEIEPTTLIAEPALMVNAPRGSAGEGRPTAKWTYAPEPPKPRDSGTAWLVKLKCPSCDERVTLSVPGKKARKKVSLSVLLCPACEAVWQWRGQVSDEPLQCPACRHGYDPRKGNVPDDGVFRCPCGQRDDIIASIRRLPQDKRLPIRPYAIQAYYPIDEADDEEEDEEQGHLFETGEHRKAERRVPPPGFLIPKNGKFFRRFTASDQARLMRAERLWKENEERLPYPKSKIPPGDKTKSGLLAHHYNYWHEMFA
ncbi:MAG: hypothetical protein HY922_05890, partial [Elusimicrobia bacterium]|nr:hypothetical protein [Elusimicrobiota bacterium]